MRKNLNVIAAYSIMMGLIILVGIFQSWNIALSIFNLCLISAVMTMGAPIVITAEIRHRLNIDRAMFQDWNMPTRIIKPIIILYAAITFKFFLTIPSL